MQLSNRLQMVISLVEPGSTAADIGTDHGFVAIDLVQKGICKKVLAMDVRKGPLSRAVEHVEQAGLTEQITCRLSDGLHEYKEGEADTILIAGMGGDLMVRILQEGWDKIRNNRLVLSPHSEWEKVREYILSHGFTIQQEKMVLEEGKYYIAIQAAPGEEAAYDEVELLFGRKLLKGQNSVLLSYLDQQEKKLTDLIERMKEQATEHALSAKIRMEGELMTVQKAKERYL